MNCQKCNGSGLILRKVEYNCSFCTKSKTTSSLYNVSSVPVFQPAGAVPHFSLDFNILKPLIRETVNKIHKLDPINAQTGPARRNDKNIMKMHLEMLDDKKTISLYKTISDMIKDKYGN